jgi:hypothetical protein
MLGTNNLPDKTDDELARLVRQTIQAAGQPEYGRLRQLMPPPPNHSRARRMMQWQRPLTAVALAAFLLLSSVGLYRSSHQWGGYTPTLIAATATQTTAPTKTALPTSTAVVQQTAVATPAPLPTPIAAVQIRPSATHSNMP